MAIPKSCLELLQPACRSLDPQPFFLFYSHVLTTKTSSALTLMRSIICISNFSGGFILITCLRISTIFKESLAIT